MSNLRVLHDVNQTFLNLIQGLYKQFNHEGYKWFEEDENGDVIVGGAGMSADVDGKYVINYDKPLGTLSDEPDETKAIVVATLEDVDNGGIAGVLTDPDNCPQVKLRSEIIFPEF